MMSHGGMQLPRELFYRAICELWLDLGQKLRTSTGESGRHDEGKHGGPLIRFFNACVGPVLGDEAPSGGGIAKIVRRHRGHTTLKRTE
jgi:hypothetical protein